MVGFCALSPLAGHDPRAAAAGVAGLPVCRVVTPREGEAICIGVNWTLTGFLPLRSLRMAERLA